MPATRGESTAARTSGSSRHIISRLRRPEPDPPLSRSAINRRRSTSAAPGDTTPGRRTKPSAAKDATAVDGTT